MADRFTRFEDRPWVSTYVPLPLDLIAKTGAIKQEVQDKGHAETEEHLGKQWNRLAPDAEHFRKLKSEHESTIDSFSNKDFNDPQVKYEWSLAKRKMANDLGPDGAAGAQQANYNAHIAAAKEYDEMLKKGDITKQQKDYLLQKAIDDYTAKGGIGEKGPQGYQTIQHETPALNPDIDKQVLEETANWKEETQKRGWYQVPGPDGKYITKYTTDVSSINPEEIKRAILPNIMGKPENQAYVKQQVDANFYGTNADPRLKDAVYRGFFERPVEASAYRLGFKSVSTDVDKSVDPEYLKGLDKPKTIPEPWGFHSTEGEVSPQYKMDPSIERFIDKDGKVNLDPEVTKAPWSMKLTGENLPDKYSKEGKLEAIKKIYEIANRFGINKDPKESENSFANRAIDASKKRQQTVLVNKVIPGNIGVNMDKYLLGKNGNSFYINYDDIITPDDSSPKPSKDFISENNIDPSTIKHESVSFDRKHPGYIQFSANKISDKGSVPEPIIFYAKSKNIDMKESFSDVNKIISKFKDFYSGDDNVVPVKREIVTKDGEKISYTEVTDKSNKNKGSESEFIGINNLGQEVFVIINPETGVPSEYGMDDLKDRSLSNFIEGKGAEPLSYKEKETKNISFKKK